MVLESKINSTLGSRPHIEKEASFTPNITLHKSETLGMLYECFLLT